MRVNHNTKMSCFTALEEWQEAEEFPTLYPIWTHAGSVPGISIMTTLLPRVAIVAPLDLNVSYSRLYFDGCKSISCF